MDTGTHALHVRHAILADAGSIAECLGELGYGTPATLVEQRIREFDAGHADAVFVAHRPQDDMVLGVASAHALPLFHAPGRLVRLTSLAVRRSAQRSGVGRLLVASVEQWAWQAGAVRIEVTSGDHRPDAHRFYQAIGYALDERRFIKRVPAGQ